MLKNLSEFENHLNLRGLSKSSIQEIKRDLILILEYLTKSLEEITQQDLENALLSLKQSHNLKNVSLNRKITSLRLYFTYLYERNLIPSNPTKNLKFARRIKGSPTFLSKEELKSLLQASSSNPFCNTIIQTFYELGIRLSELINLKTEDINPLSMQIKIHGKGQSIRYIPISRQLLLKLSLLSKSNKGFLFTFPNGSPLTPRWLQKMIKYYAQESNLQKRISPHTLRHTNATHSLEAEIDIFTIKKLLGHHSLSSTLIYTHLTEQKLHQSHQKLIKYALN